MTATPDRPASGRRRVRDVGHRTSGPEAVALNSRFRTFAAGCFEPQLACVVLGRRNFPPRLAADSQFLRWLVTVFPTGRFESSRCRSSGRSSWLHKWRQSLLNLSHTIDAGANRRDRSLGDPRVVIARAAHAGTRHICVTGNSRLCSLIQAYFTTGPFAVRRHLFQNGPLQLGASELLP